MFGPGGFATVSQDRHALHLAVDGAETMGSGGPLADLAEDDRLGVLFIELTTRRRLRVNGTVARVGGGRLAVAVAEAYPACPKYIQRRTREAGGAAGEGGALAGEALDDELRRWIEGADTLFVASGHPGGHLDVSHRGGEPGFVQVVNGALRVPDYPGNSMFNTLGNLHADPRAGDRGAGLRRWPSAEPHGDRHAARPGPRPGRPRRSHGRHGPVVGLPPRTLDPDHARPAAALERPRSLALQPRARGGWLMRLVVAEKALVARDTVRVRLADPAGAALPAFAPGAHLPLTLPDGLGRRYSLTSDPGGGRFYEITVLRTDPSGGGSSLIHDRLVVGDAVDAEPPEDGFPLAWDAPHSVFVAGGIGVTPFLTMIPALAARGASYELHHATRIRDQFLPLPERFAPVHRYSDDGTAPALDVPALLDGLDRAAHLYVCGPHGLIEAVCLTAAARGWPPARVHFESFGVSPRESDRPVTVRLLHTGNTLVVPPGTTILDAMLGAGVWASHQCRRGTCGSYFVPVLEGEPDHRDLCLAPAQRAQGLCTCVSWATSKELLLEL